MIRLRAVGVLSSARILAVVQAAIGILVGFLFLLFAAVGAAIVPGQQRLGMIGIVVIAVLMPVFYGVLGFVMGAVWAFVYSVVAQSIGGLELEFETLPALGVAPPVQAAGL
jgi:hypothetical protein